MFLAKPLRFRADLVCARSYAGKGAVLRSGAFLCPADPARQVDSRILVCDPAAGIASPASTSARTQLASCPCKSRCVTLSCELLWRIPVSEPTLRSCRGSVDTVACDSVPVSVPQISLAQALDIRLTCGFVPRFASMLRSTRGGGASRPARRVQAGLGEEREPACRLRPQHVCLHLAHPSMYGTTCPYLPFGCQPSRQCFVSMHRTACPFLMCTAPPARRGRRIHAVRELWQGDRPARTKMPLCWQDAADMRSLGARRWQNALPSVRRWRNCTLMRSWATGSGNILARCVLGGLAVARFRRGAFPGGNPWQVLRSMHPESGPGRENRPLLARFAHHASETSWLWQDVRAMHPKSPANRRRRIHRAKILPGGGTFRCTGPSNHARRANLAIL